MISSDFTIDYVNKRIYHSANSNVYTVNALYSYLQDTFDELAQMDDTIPMSAQTPTDYTLINGWFMDDLSFQYLKGGAIQTSGHLNEIQILTLQSSGYVNAVASDIGKIVTDDGGNTGALLDYNNTTRKWWIRWNATIANTSVIAVVSGTGAGAASGASTTGENLYPNVYTLGSIEEDDNQQIYIIQNGARLTEWWPESGAGTRQIDVLIKTKEAGTEIANGVITVFLRHYPTGGNADLYDHFGIDLTAGGRNAVPLATSPDLNNTTATATVSGYSDITIAFVNGTLTYSAISGTFTNLEPVSQAVSGATGIFLYQTTTTGAGTMTLGNVVGTFNSTNIITGGTSGATATSSSILTEAYTMSKNFEQGSSFPYSVVIGCATRVLTQAYEYFKYVTRVGSTFSMYPTAKAQGGAVTHSALQGQQYIRAHEDNQTTPDNTFSPVKASPFGTFAGGKFFGAQGVWIENMAAADIQNFQLIDSNGVTRTPPNKQSIIITNLLSGDRVSVFKTTSGTTIDKAMYSLAAGNNSGNSTIVVSGAIANDTPATGAIRLVDTSDLTSTRETRYTYTSWSGSTFSGVSPTLDRSYTASDDKAYVPFIDEQASSTSITVQVIYVSDRTILLRVRRKAAVAILPFETTGTFGSTGFSTSAIRTTDTIVT
ncbi:hypothetical protein A3I56_01760 [Candidatus Roizmanbacteria bacterium RIFCSPLOWO2_02_FULL_43_10]|uniref:Uncharacterized protein n=2 Tax=Candidatus Roizmaniibacteriota TaxID=1752723 RepID=A0A1F7JTY0_9BACT|nr:MAG: hypothetical protein A3D08_00860 [Candidatus Roizmanbacteria bacterium RIFCSPHIGHO2_02_FULL_43_11]OGK59063.1 MAG: hypothetical protein A3I56_01760 [Candidatus Roizmanbacteria bacterium RIFCSPLOWO2_02_FULL_43_10]